MAKYDHKLFEKDIPKQQREELLKHVFFSSKGKGVYEPVGGNAFNPAPFESAMILNFGWKLWCKQQTRIEKLKDEQA